jgi:hypothetical protein
MNELFEKIYLNLRSPSRLKANLVGLSRRFVTDAWGFLVLVLLSVPLVFKFRKDRVPFRQVLMLDTSLKFTRLLDHYNIDYVLLTGSLLGAVRQRAFAGRPRDFDLAIRKRDRQKLLELIPSFKSQGLCVYECTGRRDSANGFIVAFPSLLCFQERWAEIDIHTYVECDGGKWRWDRWDQDIPMISFGLDFPTIGSECFAEIFSYKFKIPTNWEEYLVAVFGKDWRTPDSKQFSWRNPEITRS